MGRISRKFDMVKIRPAVPADAERIYLIHRASIATLCKGHYSDQDIKGWIEVLSPEIYETPIREKRMIVAEENEELTGFGIFNAASKEICALYLHPAAKGTGLGKSLLFELENRARQEGISDLALCATTNALGFYEHHGYIRKETVNHELPNGIRLICSRMYKTLDVR